MACGRLSGVAVVCFVLQVTIEEAAVCQVSPVLPFPPPLPPPASEDPAVFPDPVLAGIGVFNFMFLLKRGKVV